MGVERVKDSAHRLFESTEGLASSPSSQSALRLSRVAGDDDSLAHIVGGADDRTRAIAETCTAGASISSLDFRGPQQAVDSLIPIRRGQRELIIGERQIEQKRDLKSEGHQRGTQREASSPLFLRCHWTEVLLRDSERERLPRVHHSHCCDRVWRDTIAILGAVHWVCHGRILPR